MKKQLITLIAMLLPMLASAFTGEIEIDGIKYFIATKAQTAEVRANNYSGDIVIPATVECENIICNVTSIGNSAFYECSSLTSITIPNGVTSFGEYAFGSCSGLTSVTIPDGVTTIGNSAFSDCSSLTSITIPGSVTSIGQGVFGGCSGLTSISIPSSVTSIGFAAFSGCSGLTSVTIPSSVTTIGNSAFSGCSSLTSITIPGSVTDLGRWAFSGCSSLTSITIPGSVTDLGNEAFYDCSNLTSVTIDNGVTSIGGSAFEGCSSLTSISIPSSVTYIGKQVFRHCSSLTSVTIGSGIETINSMAFASCPELTDVYCYAENVPNAKSDAFQDSYIEYCTLHVPEAAVNDYKARAPWSSFKSIVALDGGETPETKKCATPTISYSNGKLTFNCSTEGATCQYSITDSDIKAGSSNEVQLSVTYNISVYATKPDFENSKTATAMLCWIDVEPKTEGLDAGIAQVPALAVLIQSNGGTIVVQGADDGTKVCVYSVNGTQAGSAVINNGSAIVGTNLQPGSVAIVKIGNKSVKVVVR